MIDIKNSKIIIHLLIELVLVIYIFFNLKIHCTVYFQSEHCSNFDENFCSNVDTKYHCMQDQKTDAHDSTPSHQCNVRGAFHDNFPGFSGFGFRRKLARTKTQQGIDKVSKHNRFAVFLRALVFRTHQQKWHQLFLSFILSSF